VSRASAWTRRCSLELRPCLGGHLVYFSLESRLHPRMIRLRAGKSVAALLSDLAGSGAYRALMRRCSRMISRMLLSLGVSETHPRAPTPAGARAGDVSTDGRWCFMTFKVQLSLGVPAHWALLKRRLEAVCPSAAGEHQLWRWSSLPRDFQHPFLLQVSSYDRRGFLHGARPARARPAPCPAPLPVASRALRPR